MKSTLYLKLVLAFVFIAIVSIIGGIAITELIFSKSYYKDYQRELARDGENRLFETLESSGYWIELKGANHDSFTDTPLLSPFLASFFIDKHKAYRLINQYALNFFDKYLKSDGGELLYSTEEHDHKIVFVSK